MVCQTCETCCEPRCEVISLLDIGNQVGDQGGRQDNGTREEMQFSRNGTHVQGNKYTPFPTRGRPNVGPSKEVESRQSTSISPSVSVSRSDGVGDAGTGRDGGQHSRPTRQQSRTTRTDSRLSVQSSSTVSESHVRLPSLQTHAITTPTQCSFHSCPSPSSSRPSATYLYLYKHLPKVSSDTDYDRLGRSMRGLFEGCFYYPDLDSNSARAMLQRAPEGTFLVRDSSDARYLFAVSVKTARGATSVRIQYYRGFFQLDCEEEMKRKLPRFETLLDLLDFHSRVCRDAQGAQYRWQDNSHQTSMLVNLTAPRRHSPPSLAHMARVSVNRSLQDLHIPQQSTDLLPLPATLKSYLRDYPFKV